MKEQTWQERFDEQNFTDAWAEDESNRIKQFISDLRKRDMDALIGMIDEYFRHLIIIPRPDLTGKKLLQLIQDYYEN